ncbi:MAG: PilZ domain-containing protein [Pseudomonadota bacterium]
MKGTDGNRSNIIELSSARERMRSRAPLAARSHSDKRLHTRVESNDRLFTQVVLSADNPELVGSTLSCRAVNMSVGGIQFQTSTQVPVGALLDLWVDVSSRPGKFFLAGEVRWSRPTSEVDENGQSLWFVGVQLKSGAATDIVDWRDYHAHAYAHH